MPKRLARLIALLVSIPAAAAPTTGPAPVTRPSDSTPLPGTAPLEAASDISSQMVYGVDRFLSRETEDASAHRERYWNRDLSSPEAYAKSIRPNRERLAHILGLRDARVPPGAMELVASTTQPAAAGRGSRCWGCGGR